MLDRLTWRIGFIAAAILAVIGWAGFTYQTVVLDGFRFLFVHIEGVRDERDRLRIDLDKVEEATKLADQKARAAKLAQEAEYRKKADEADREYQADLADARARADRYARLNRVRPQPGGSAGGPASSANGGGSQGADGPGEDAVILSRPDFDALNENSLRLKAAHDWACGLDGAHCE